MLESQGPVRTSWAPSGREIAVTPSKFFSGLISCFWTCFQALMRIVFRELSKLRRNVRRNTGTPAEAFFCQSFILEALARLKKLLRLHIFRPEEQLFQI